MKTSSNHQSTILNNRPSSTVNREQQKKSPISRGKSEWQKNALRICGNWSEQLSSKGKVYFYNCITEVSQWQKPQDWTLPDVSKKELLKIISERQGFDGSSIKRTYATLTQSDRNRSRPQENSPKRQKCQDTFKLATEGLQITRLTDSPSNREVDKISSNTGINTTKDHFRQLADDIRESLENILAKASTHSNSIHGSSIKNPSFPDERSPICSESSSRSTDVVNKPPDPKETFCENSQHNLMAKFQTAPSTCDISPSRSKLVNVHSTLLFKSSPPRNFPASIGGLSNGDCSHRHVSDIIRQIDSFSSKQKFDFFGVSGSTLTTSKPTDVNLDGLCRSSISDRSSKDIPAPTKPLTPSVLEKFNSPPASQTCSGNLQKQNLNNSETIRSIVTFLNTVVHARRDSPVSTANPASTFNKMSEPSNSSSVDVTTSMASTHRTHMKVEKNSLTPGSLETIANCSQKNSLRSISLKSDFNESLPESPSFNMPSRDKSPYSRTPSSVYATTGLGSCFSSDPTTVTRLNHTHSCDSLPLLSVLKKGAEDLRKSSLSYRDRLSAAILDGEKLSPSALHLEDPEMLKHADLSLSVKFQNLVADSAENEANCEFRKFDRLHSVLYSELSGELKKLKALVRISETKLSIHQKRKEALRDLMDVLEIRKSFSSLIPPD